MRYPSSVIRFAFSVLSPPLRGLCALGGKNFAGLSGRKGTARQALVGGIDPEGKVYEHLSRQGNIQYAYAGEMLQVLTGLAIPGVSTSAEGWILLTWRFLLITGDLLKTQAQELKLTFQKFCESLELIV